MNDIQSKHTHTSLKLMICVTNRQEELFRPFALFWSTKFKRKYAQHIVDLISEVGYIMYNTCLHLWGIFGLITWILILLTSQGSRQWQFFFWSFFFLFTFLVRSVFPDLVPLNAMVYACTMITIFKYYMGRVMKVPLSCYLVLLSFDSKTRYKTDALSWSDLHVAGGKLTIVNPLCNICVYSGRWRLPDHQLVLPASVVVQLIYQIIPHLRPSLPGAHLISMD